MTIDKDWLMEYQDLSGHSTSKAMEKRRTGSDLVLHAEQTEHNKGVDILLKISQFETLEVEWEFIFGSNHTNAN
jgi:hypothetical protein